MGSPTWCAIVVRSSALGLLALILICMVSPQVDPLRSLARQEPEFGCFRTYPVAYDPPKAEAPDGSVTMSDAARQQRWGVVHHRYYALEISYFNSGLGNQILDVMSKNSLWVRVLGSSSILEPEVPVL